MSKVSFVTSCCGRPVDECPGCPGAMVLVPKEEFENMTESHPIFTKIEEGTVTTDDFNRLIQEATPEAIRDRIRRRTKRNATDEHIDDEGHQRLELPTYADRVQPKRERTDRSQNNGRGKAGHRRSARTQKRTMHKAFESVPPRFKNAARFLVENIGQPITESLVDKARDVTLLPIVIPKFMALPGVDRNWLDQLSRRL